MDVHTSLVFALNKPRSYTEWYYEATRIRKEHGETLSKATFNKAKKELEESGFIISKNIDGREKEFSIVPDKKTLFTSFKKVEDEIPELVEIIDQFKKSDKEFLVVLIQNPDFIDLVISSMQLVLEVQKYFSMYHNSHLCLPVNKTSAKRSIESCNEILNKSFQILNNIDNDFANRVYVSMYKKNTESFELENQPKYLRDPEKTLNIISKDVAKEIMRKRYSKKA